MKKETAFISIDILPGFYYSKLTQGRITVYYIMIETSQEKSTTQSLSWNEHIKFHAVSVTFIQRRKLVHTTLHERESAWGSRHK